MGKLEQVLAGEQYLVFDGAMGTMLQQRGLVAGESPEMLCLESPDEITAIHRAYVEAGSQVVTTNTFGANRLKLGDAETVERVFLAAVKCAGDAGAPLVAGDIGPTGELMCPMGDLGFSEAYALFAEQARAAEEAGADLLIIETMADTLEMAAAVMAAKQACSMPVFATMTFTASGRTFMGSSPKDAALVMALLGADAIGVNCSAGPAGLQPIVAEMCSVSPVPVIVQANAGLPDVVDGRTSYALSQADYAAAVVPMIDAGATVVGGCCGTTPDYIRELSPMLLNRVPVKRSVTVEDAFRAAEESAEGGGRDGGFLEMILEAADLEELKGAFAEEYDD